jgi:hypothetical protein
MFITSVAPKILVQRIHKRNPSKTHATKDVPSGERDKFGPHVVAAWLLQLLSLALCIPPSVRGTGGVRAKWMKRRDVTRRPAT